MTATFTLDRLPTPVGEMILLTGPDGALVALDWDDHADRMRAWLTRRTGRAGFALVDGRAPAAVRAPLVRYLAGDLPALAEIPVADDHGTPFERRCWAALRTIPAGHTWSYAAQALHIGQPNATRAVGMANGRNPIGVVIPCHRVIGAGGHLTGYGGGLPRKRWLLEHEGAIARLL